MFHNNRWGGQFKVDSDIDQTPLDDDSSCTTESHRPSSVQLNEMQQGWFLNHTAMKKKRKKYDIGCFVCTEQMLQWTVLSALIALVVVGIPIVILKNLPKHIVFVTEPDNYTMAVHRALKFFNAQKSGRLPKNNKVPWRGDSGLHDGSELTDVIGGLVGGYYDSGNNIKFHFPMAFSMTLLSWSVLEYGPKYTEIGEYDHTRDTIKWGIDYLLRTFNSSASTISKMYSQVGVAKRDSSSPDDGYCWQRPEDMNYSRPVQTSTIGPDLASEVASALAAASIVFSDNFVYSQKLIKAAKTAYKFATGPGQDAPYSNGNQFITDFYNSTSYWDELLWGAAWMYYATGNYTYLSSATDIESFNKATDTQKKGYLNVFSWDNKLPGAQLLLTRLRIFLNPGYPYETMLSSYHNNTGLSMCSYFQPFIFNRTKGGLIQLNHGQPHQLQYAANAAFLASLFSDYMNKSNIPGWYCGHHYFNSSSLKEFATSQIDYILGVNPRNMSYLVGFGKNYPKHVHHRGASIRRGRRVSCTEGWTWRDRKAPNPNIITGAMVSGPSKFDRFSDVRNKRNFTEPTLVGNSGLVSALMSIARCDFAGIDRNSIFSFVPPLYPEYHTPPSS